MAYMRKDAEDSYRDKLDRMGIGISTASTGARATGHVYPQDDGSQGDAQGSRAKGYATEDDNERTLDAKAPKKLRLDRKPFKDGGRVKRNTTVNVIVAPQGGGATPMPPAPPPVPPQAMAKPPMPMPGGAPDMPMPGGGAPPMMRANGGRVPHMKAGAGSGEGRLEKIKEYGDNAKPHRKHGGSVGGNWIKGAIEHPGSLRKTAKRDGLIRGDEKLSGKDLTKLSDSDNATTRRRANLAKTLKKMD